MSKLELYQKNVQQYDPATQRGWLTTSLPGGLAVFPLVMNRIKDAPYPARILDIGCGLGSFLWPFHATGDDVYGVDGPWVDSTQVLIPEHKFYRVDLESTTAENLLPVLDQIYFDLILCTEVIEHLSQEVGPRLIEWMSIHSHRVLFAGATPGQGGQGHINERPFDYWKALFFANGLTECDTSMRKPLAELPCVASWYYNNLALFSRPNVE